MAAVTQPAQERPATTSGEAVAGYEATDLKLKKTMGLTQLTALSLGALIGSGWLFAVLFADGVAGPASMFSWLIGGVACMFIAFTYMELSAMLPRSGALSRYPQLTHGGYTGMLLAWAYLLSASIVPTIEAEASVTYISSKFPTLGLITPHSTILAWPSGIMLGYGFMVLFFFLNILGIKLLAEVNRWVVLWKLVIPTVTFILVFFAFRSSNYGAAVGGFAPLGGSPIFAAVTIAGIGFSFLGFRQALEYAGEARNPQRDVPRATIISLSIAIVIYTALQIAFTGAIRWGPLGLKVGNWSALGTSKWATGPLYQEMHAAGMGVLAGFAALLLWDAVISPAGTGWVYTGTGTRTFYGMSVQRLFPPGLQVMNRFGIPWISLLASTFVAGLFFVRQPSWYNLVGFITSTTVLTYIMGGTGVMSLRRLAPTWRRPVRLPYPWLLSAMGFVAASLIVYWSDFSTLIDVVTFVSLSIAIYLMYYAPAKGFMTTNQGLTLGLVFLAAWVWIAAKGGWVLRAGTLPVHGAWTFGTYYTIIAVTLVLVTVATWLLSTEEGRKHINASWWFIFYVLAILLVSYYGSLGVSFVSPKIAKVATVAFPWDYLVVIGIALVSFFWSVHSAFETDELRDLHAALTEGRPLEPVPEMEEAWAPLHGAGTPAGGSTTSA